MSGIPVLLVDDEPRVLMVLEAALAAEGFDPVPCAHPEEAVDLAEKRRVRVVVLDVMMPGLDGFGVLERLRARESTRDLPVLMLSAMASGSDRVRGLEAGADDYLAKPFHPDELVIRLRRLLERAEARAATLEGDLGRLAAGDILQQVLGSGMTGVLEIEGTPPGRVEVGAGRLLRASCGALEGESALFVLLDRREGRFRFREGPVEEGGEGLGLQGALMQLAWLEDELERRRHLLPDAQAPLEAREGTPPESECRLLDTVHGWLLSHPGSSLADLEGRVPFAPQQLRVAVTILREAGLVDPVEGSGGAVDVAAGGEPAPGAVRPAMEEAVRRLAGRAVAMGHAPGVVHLLVAVAPARWEAFLREVVAALPGEILEHSPAGVLRELEDRGSSSLRLRAAGTTLLVHLHRMAGLAGLRARAFLPMASVVVMAPAAQRETALEELVAAAARLDPGPERLVVLPEQVPDGGFEVPEGWQVLERSPASLEELLQAVSSLPLD